MHSIHCIIFIVYSIYKYIGQYTMYNIQRTIYYTLSKPYPAPELETALTLYNG